jgi:hypothetical protein
VCTCSCMVRQPGAGSRAFLPSFWAISLRSQLFAEGRSTPPSAGWNVKSSSGREGRLGLQKRLREKCLERVKKDRSKLMAQLRSIGPAGGSGGGVKMMETLAHSLIQEAQAESSSAAHGTCAAGDDSMDQEGSVRVGICLPHQHKPDQTEPSAAL